MKKPDQRNHHNHRNPKKHDPAVVMEVPVKESPIHTGSKFGYHKNAQAVLCHRQWNCDRDDQRFPSPGAQEKMRQHHRGHNQH